MGILNIFVSVAAESGGRSVEGTSRRRGVCYDRLQ